MKILQVVAEHYGLVKTGGLADMVASLAIALSQQNVDVRVCLPAYPGTIERLTETKYLMTIAVNRHSFDVIEGRLPATDQYIILLNCPELFARAGDPYRDHNGEEFPDNGRRFGCFCQAVTQLVLKAAGAWQPDIIHLHDWHTGLVALLLRHYDAPVRTVFTIHNFSFHGIFERQVFDDLDLPVHWWHPDGIEFYGRFSFMKAALEYSDSITVVSPRYAREIGTPEFGCGLEGLVRRKKNRIRGIINGIDQREWNPARDANIAEYYTRKSVTEGKAANKSALQELLGLPISSSPLFIFIGRLAEQKGSDLILAARHRISQLPLQLVVLGCGDKGQEQGFKHWARETPRQLAAVLEVNEKIAHLMTAAADVQILPSRFEPCGLSQMYAQRYGTLPVAHSTGGLADTIVDLTPNTFATAEATGFLFPKADTENLIHAMERAVTLLQDPGATKQLRRTAMSRDFSWNGSAAAYRDLYETLSLVPVAEPS